MAEKEQPLRLSDEESSVGKALELPPQDRARLTIAVNVLGALAFIVILAFLILVAGPDNWLAEARAIFEFVKTIVPPIVTLVIGFYFRNESA